MSPKQIAIFGCVVMLCACESSGPSAPAFTSANNITITRADGGRISFAPNVWAWCGAWEDGVVVEPTAHVLVGSAASRWEFRVVQRDVVLGRTMSFPNTFIWDQPRGADMFVHDPPNELSTQGDESSGAVIIDRLDCRPGGGISFTIDAVVASEFGNGPPVTVTGNFTSPLTRRPGG
jgi:hypothetical protein